LDGLCIDQNGNLYVANQGNNTVTVYPSRSTSPSVTYSQDLSRPLYPIVDAHGDLFVGNANTGTVIEYPSGSTSASEVLQTAGHEADGMDFDLQGNLYVAYRNASYGIDSSIEEFAPGSTQGTILGMSLNQPQAVVVDNKANILAVETGGTNRVDFFPPGATSPKFTVDLPPPGDPTQLAMPEKEAELFVSSWTTGDIYVTHYPLRERPR
jgi:sugar lactone lactonase YvrE